MAERPFSAILAPNTRVRVRGIDPPSDPVIFTTDPQGGLLETVAVHSDVARAIQLGITRSGQKEQRIHVPGGTGRIHLNDYL